MPSRLIALPLLLATLIACKPPPEAPTELGELSLYLFANFETEDPAVMEVGMANLQAYLVDYEGSTDLSMESSAVDRSWQIPPLTEEHWGGADHVQEIDPNNFDSVSVAVRSRHEGTAHASLIGMADQTPLESSSSAAYNRTFETDFDEWLSAEEGILRTTNSIDRDNILLTLTYECEKDYRWIRLPDGTVAAAGRSWITQSYINEDGAGGPGEDTMHFFSNFEVTFFDGSTEGETLRYNALWGYVDFEPAVDEAILLNTVRNGIQEGFENTEAYLDDQVNG